MVMRNYLRRIVFSAGSASAGDQPAGYRCKCWIATTKPLTILASLVSITASNLSRGTDLLFLHTSNWWILLLADLVCLVLPSALAWLLRTRKAEHRLLFDLLLDAEHC